YPGKGSNPPEPAHLTDGSCPKRAPQETDSRGGDRLRGNETGRSHGHEQQALLEEAEKRDQEFKKKLRN
ncbi:hypothetical protein PIB30_023473, partial [Stylosanthes scabra]|nr:hypothetical protein [Stylosanthes scabra]